VAEESAVKEVNILPLKVAHGLRGEIETAAINFPNVILVPPARVVGSLLANASVFLRIARLTISYNIADNIDYRRQMLGVRTVARRQAKAMGQKCVLRASI
jgi:hypothetical protein